MKLLSQPLAAPCGTLLVALGAAAIGVLFPTATVLVWMEEEGPVEAWTLLLYFLAVLAVCGDRERLRTPVWLALVTLLVAAAGREMDWHKAFTEVSIIKVGYYLGSGSWVQKLGALAAVASTILAAAYLARRFARPLWRGLRRRDPAAWTALTFFAVLVASKAADRSLGLLAEDWGLRSSAGARAVQLAVEEILELALPALVLLGLVQLRQADGLAAVPAAVATTGAAQLPDAVESGAD